MSSPSCITAGAKNKGQRTSKQGQAYGLRAGGLAAVMAPDDDQRVHGESYADHRLQDLEIMFQEGEQVTYRDVVGKVAEHSCIDLMDMIILLSTKIGSMSSSFDDFNAEYEKAEKLCKESESHLKHISLRLGSTSQKLFEFKKADGSSNWCI